MLNLKKIFRIEKVYFPNSKKLYEVKLEWFGKYRLHWFARGDAQREPHSHPWSWLSFPLTTYIEEVWDFSDTTNPEKHLNVVKAFRVHYRPATYTHILIGGITKKPLFHLDEKKFGDYYYSSHNKVVTLVKRGPKEQEWGFWVKPPLCLRWEWVHWKKYHGIE